MARKLKTGETTNLGFIRALKERGTTAKPEFPASTLRSNLDDVSTKKITFLSPNETVVESVNQFSPKPPVPQDYVNFVLSAIDGDTGEELIFSATVTDPDTSAVVAEVVDASVLEAVILKNKIYNVDITSDGYDSTYTSFNSGSDDEYRLTFNLIPSPRFYNLTAIFMDSTSGENIEVDNVKFFDETAQKRSST